jgi:hypothetical protein
LAGARFVSITGASPAGDVLRPTKHTKRREISEPEIDSSLASGQEALVFESRVMAEVHEQPQLATGCAEIVEKLRSMLIYQLGDCFDFNDDLVVANEIRTECLDQCAAAILQRLRWFRQKWNSLEFQLDFKALMINRLEKPASLISINGKARAEIA